MNTPPRSGRLFGEHMGHHPPADVHLAEIDGASRGNPGPASYGVVLRGPNGRVEWEMGKSIGTTTNNVAEYHALLAALEGAVSRGVRSLRVRSDSLLMVRQMEGRYKVKSADLRPLHERAMKAARAMQYFAIEYVPREQNRTADRLANHALDNRMPGRRVPDDMTDGRNDSAELQRFEAGTVKKPRVARGKRLIAHYADGALHLTEPLELHQGEEVEVTVHSRRK
jgi:ribonuclease HI